MEHRQDIHAEIVALIPGLRAFAYVLTGNRACADKYVQEALQRAVRQVDQFQPEMQLRAWLFAIMASLILEEDAGDTRQPAVQPHQSARDQRERPPSAPTDRRARIAFFSLAREQRAALFLVDVAGTTTSEAAEICWCTSGAIEIRLAQGRAFLKRTASGQGASGAKPGSLFRPSSAPPSRLRVRSRRYR